VPKIMVRCPTLGGKVPTGLTTEKVLFASLPAKIKMPLRCPAYGQIHKWGARSMDTLQARLPETRCTRRHHALLVDQYGDLLGSSLLAKQGRPLQRR
jgi:hypothetical protein